MNILKSIIALLLIASFFTSCDFISNSLTYKDITAKFTESVIQEDYDKSLSYMATDHVAFKDMNLDTLKHVFKKFHNIIVKEFGKELDYKLMTASKSFGTVKVKNTLINTTTAQIQFSNKEYFGAFEIVFDDTSNKILNIRLLEIKEKIPNMFFFWLFGIFPLLVVAFNVYVIRLIKNSNLKHKWLKYLAVAFFNVPAITYNAISGLSYSLLSFQILLGLDFSYMGYLNAAMTFGIPLGGIYWLWKLNKLKQEEYLMVENI